MALADELAQALYRRRECRAPDDGGAGGTPSCGVPATGAPPGEERTGVAAEDRGLTAKQARFVEEYLVDLNGTQAAIRAGYSAQTARSIAYENLSKPAIADAIAAAQAERSQRTQITADRVLQEFAKIGFGDIRQVFDDKGQLKLPKDLSDEAAAGVASIEVVIRPIVGGEKGQIEYVHKVRHHDKIAALTQIGRHLGMFTDKVEAKGGLTLEQLVMASMKSPG